MRKAALALTVGAVVCGAAAGTIRFVLVPNAEQVQSDTHTVNDYTGTVTFLDQKAAMAGDLANAIKTDVPFTAVEDFKTASLNGKTAVINDVTTTSGPAAAVLGNSTVAWSVDRKTLLPLPAPAGVTTTDHQGLAVGFPFAPDAKDAPWWDGGTGTAATAKYAGTETHAGRTAYKFTVDVTGPLADKGLLGQLPPAIPVPLLTGLAQTMGADKAAALQMILPKDATTVPLTYTSTTKSTMWVDKFSGTTIDADNRQTVTATMKVAGAQIPLTAVLDVHTLYSPKGIASAVKQSKDDESRMLWEGEVAPIGLAALAVLMLGGAAWTARRKPAVAGGAAEESAAPAEASEAAEAAEPSESSDAGDSEDETESEG